MDGRPSRVAITVESFLGPRSDLASLFREADDSLSEIDSYKELGEVIVTRHDEKIVGHLQLIKAAVDRGYPPTEVDGIPVRDRVWFCLDNHKGGP